MAAIAISHADLAAGFPCTRAGASIGQNQLHYNSTLRGRHCSERIEYRAFVSAWSFDITSAARCLLYSSQLRTIDRLSGGPAFGSAYLTRLQTKEPSKLGGSVG